MTKIWAHRGASGYAPENTLEAFGLAVEQKADGVELDVQMTRDNQLVVIHDETLDRVSGEKGFVKAYTLEELKRLNVNKTIPGYKEVKIPTLEEVYDSLKGTGLEINVEIKSSIFWYPQIEEKVLELTKQKDMLDKVIFSSFNHNSVKMIKEMEPAANTAILYSDVLCNLSKYAEMTKVDALHPLYIQCYMNTVWEEYQQTKLPLHVWTVNEEKDMKFFVEQEVDALITNYPDIAWKVREGLK